MYVCMYVCMSVYNNSLDAVLKIASHTKSPVKLEGLRHLGMFTVWGPRYLPPLFLRAPYSAYGILCLGVPMVPLNL